MTKDQAIAKFNAAKDKGTEKGDDPIAHFVNLIDEIHEILKIDRGVIEAMFPGVTAGEIFGPLRTELEVCMECLKAL